LGEFAQLVRGRSSVDSRPVLQPEFHPEPECHQRRFAPRGGRRRLLVLTAGPGGARAHATVPVEVRVALPSARLPLSAEAAAYFTVCEALTNVAKYARASRAWVNVEQLDGHLGVEVGDDGAGGADRRAGSGLQGLRDRIAAVNGTLTIDSQPGAGTVLRARLPID
jgi:signal transduction histidine kinase